MGGNKALHAIDENFKVCQNLNECMCIHAYAISEDFKVCQNLNKLLLCPSVLVHTLSAKGGREEFYKRILDVNQSLRNQFLTMETSEKIC